MATFKKEMQIGLKNDLWAPYMLQAYVHDFGYTTSIREYSGHGRKDMETKCIHFTCCSTLLGSLKLSWEYSGHGRK